MKWMLIAGARPNFMKIAPVLDAIEKHNRDSVGPRVDPVLVHTGQHYDAKMSDLFFNQLGIRKPDVNLEVGSATHAVQTAEIMRRFEPVLLEHRPKAVIVVGDVNSTLACGLVAVKLGVKLVHVEAGLRSFDRTMPEEINRLLTDAISDLLFCTEQSGVINLAKEGVASDKVFLVGNVMIDTLLKYRAIAERTTVLEDLKLQDNKYVVVTLHRPSNVDNPQVLQPLVTMLETIARDVPVVFPVHPRTRAMIASLSPQTNSRLRLLDPLGYLEFLKLMAHARGVLTDSGGIQEETTILNIPCLTIRENTERPVTLSHGTNVLVGSNPERILAAWNMVAQNPPPHRPNPPFWDGQAADRLVRICVDRI